MQSKGGEHVEDAVLELHLKHMRESVERIEETTSTGFLDLGARQTKMDDRMTTLEKSVEKLKSNPILAMGGGIVGSGGIFALVFHYLQSGGTVVP